ncbi:MAG TPA: LysR family transcriptional regulator [Candidatus Tenderia sp.]|nr:LysR family transcriptional regulator [Candidatus Tenderia sp.]
MNINDLHAFVSVSEHGSFSLAAEALHLTQPAVSKRIAALEQTLGTQLFDRVGRTITPTEAGRALLHHAQRILGEVEDSRRAIANLEHSVKGQLKLATSHHIGLHRLPRVLKQFIQQYPEVQLDLSFMDSEQACRAVEQGAQELSLITLPPQTSTQLELIEVWTDRLVLTVSPSHPLAREATINAEVLARHPAILPARGTYTRELIDQQLGLPDINTQLETHYLETIKMMVEVGMGWSLWPDNMIDDELKPEQGSDIAVERKLGIVRHPQRTLSNAARAFIDICRSAA